MHQSGLKELILKDTNVSIYNLKKDIGEKANVINQNGQMLLLMEKERRKWESFTIPPSFLGLMQEQEYNNEHKPKK